MTEFRMPSLGADMTSGTLLEWLVKPGDRVHRGDVVAVVGTDKGEIEAEIFEDGVVGQLVVAEGAEVPVQTVIALIHKEGEEDATPVIAAHANGDVANGDGQQGIPRATGRRVRVSPLARKLAAELGVDLNSVQGSGENGAINRADVEKASEQESADKQAARMLTPLAETPSPSVAEGRGAIPAPRPPDDKGSADFQIGVRRAIALAMTRANRDIPHYYLQTRINMRAALTWLENENAKRSVADRVLPVVLLIKAVAKALTKVPELNGYWIDDRLQVQEAIHIGFAIALRQGGLVTPALLHADLKDMDQLMADLRDLIVRTRSGRLRSSEMTAATLTVTSLGELGVETVYGVIYPPQVALAGFGTITDQVWVEDGMLGVRPVLTATIAGDHRATDGRTGAQFLDVLATLLHKPETLWD